MSDKLQLQQRTVRILNLLAYVGKHPGSTVMEICLLYTSDAADE